MKKVVRLTETQLIHLIKRVIKEQPIDDEDEEGITIGDDEIIQMIMNSESEIDQEDYDDVYDWMLVIFSDVESQLTDMGVDDDIVDDIRMKYDDVLMSIWRGGNDN